MSLRKPVSASFPLDEEVIASCPLDEEVRATTSTYNLRVRKVRADPGADYPAISTTAGDGVSFVAKISRKPAAVQVPFIGTQVFVLESNMRFIPTGPNLSRLSIALALRDAHISWTYTDTGQLAVSRSDLPFASGHGTYEISTDTIVSAASGRLVLPRHKYPARCFILGVMTFSDVIVESSEQKTFRDVSILLDVDPTALLLVVHGSRNDTWTQSFGTHWENLLHGNSIDHVFLTMSGVGGPRFDYPRVTCGEGSGFFIHGSFCFSKDS